MEPQTSLALSDQLLARIAGWEAVQQARQLVATGKVRASEWSPPLLKGLVQEGNASLRAGLVIKNAIDVDNLCSCRPARAYGLICAHSVAVGLHYLRSREVAPPIPGSNTSGTRAPRLAAGAPAKTAAPARAARRILRVEPGQPGEPAEVFVIFPPNLAQALEKGKVMLVFEAAWQRGRMPLNALPLTIPFQFSRQDAALLDQVETMTGGDTPGMVLLSAPDLARLLETLVDHPGLTLGKSQALQVSALPFRGAVQATLEPTGEITLRLSTRLPRALLSDPAKPWVFEAHALRPLGLPRACLELCRGPLRLGRERVPVFLSQDWVVLEQTWETTANFSLGDFSLEPRPPEFHLHLAGGLASLVARLTCRYGDFSFSTGDAAPDAASWLPDPACATRYWTRDLTAEQAAVARLYRSGFTGPHGEGHFQLAGQNQVLNFFARVYPRLRRDWQVTLDERLESSTGRNLEAIQPEFRVTASGENWFDLEVQYASGSGEKFSAADIQRLLLAGQGHTRLRNGRIALLDTASLEEFQEVLRDVAPQQSEGKFRIHAAHASCVQATLSGQPGWTVRAPGDWQQRVRTQSGEITPQCPPLGALETVLRPYQKQGVAWMWFLRQHEFGGILADEMGLGKTLQALTYITVSTPRSEALGQPEASSAVGSPAPLGTRLPSLVVCPTSLVFNWVAEANRFTPGLRVLALDGPERHARFAAVPSADLVVTSYALIRRDAALYQGQEFDTVFLDEAQHIKNRQTQNAQAVKAIRSRRRFVLTGTPLENSVLDLWSIFDFLMPGYLGAAADFRERYELPISRDQDEATQTRLARRIRPFLLRRLKKDVAAELPARLEQVAYCDLTAEQAAVYRQVLEASRQELLAAAGTEPAWRNRLQVLTALLRLRQVCCDLRLLDLPGAGSAAPSGKLELFAELLDEILDGGHRVLVFSQFVSMLALLRQRLEELGVDYCYLDGSTPDRGAVVARFQGTPGVPVFLISLKAGGTGLNLTGADTVIHFDPWWNPAVEAQATDRAHRLGQTRTVTSYKLISRGTVEEKILRLQNRKQEVIQATLGGEEQLIQSLSWKEIQELLAD